jgi:spoIIIJ-associated protein
VEAPQSIEAIGATVEEAIGRGLEALNITRDDVDVLILSAESDRTARVRLTRRPRAAAPTAAAAATQTVTSDESAAAQRLLQAVLDRMKYQVQITQRDPAELNGYDEQDEPTLVLDIRGNDLSTLIGRRGETLDGLQYLVRLLVAKELGHYVHVVLDVEGYKAHRAQMLKQLALRMAERVVTTHKPAALEPMPANERRIVHLALRDNTQVRTESVGLGENRKVTIIPQSYKR